MLLSELVLCRSRRREEVGREVGKKDGRKDGGWKDWMK